MMLRNKAGVSDYEKHKELKTNQLQKISLKNMRNSVLQNS